MEAYTAPGESFSSPFHQGYSYDDQMSNSQRAGQRNSMSQPSHFHSQFGQGNMMPMPQGQLQPQPPAVFNINTVSNANAHAHATAVSYAESPYGVLPFYSAFSMLMSLAATCVMAALTTYYDSSKWFSLTIAGADIDFGTRSATSCIGSLCTTIDIDKIPYASTVADAGSATYKAGFACAVGSLLAIIMVFRASFKLRASAFTLFQYLSCLLTGISGMIWSGLVVWYVVAANDFANKVLPDDERGSLKVMWFLALVGSVLSWSVAGNIARLQYQRSNTVHVVNNPGYIPL